MFYGTVVKDGDTITYQNGLVHKEDGPAIIKADGTEIYMLEGEVKTEEQFKKQSRYFIHKAQIESGLRRPPRHVAPPPVSTTETGIIENKNLICHCVDDILHNENGPAVVYNNEKHLMSSYMMYFQHGIKTRDDGPAYISADTEVWYKNGKIIKEAYNGPSL